MNRRLVTCPVCQCDQYVYANKLVKHGAVSNPKCDGSGYAVDSNGLVTVKSGDCIEVYRDGKLIATKPGMPRNGNSPES